MVNLVNIDTLDSMDHLVLRLLDLLVLLHLVIIPDDEHSLTFKISKTFGTFSEKWTYFMMINTVSLGTREVLQLVMTKAGRGLASEGYPEDVASHPR
jgi:hypothetical protein